MFALNQSGRLVFVNKCLFHLIPTQSSMKASTYSLGEFDVNIQSAIELI